MRRALVVDLDGVLREWPRDAIDGPQVPGLDQETVRAVLFEPELLRRVVVGEISDEQWQLEAAVRLHEEHGVECSSALLEARAYPGRVRTDVLDICRRGRATVPVCLLTNATSRLDDHLSRLALGEEFDRVFNSSELGVAKPDVRIFERVCADLRLDPSDIVFIDDTEGHVHAAESVGMRAHRFTTPSEMQRTLVHESLLSPDR